ncbi:MAG: 2OG-Fe(II) oxygenase [Deltaproteobacteria bacterium]|nr:2OG-Fe(II) oxygenase [Deltaproteobacteria bacterium]
MPHQAKPARIAEHIAQLDWPQIRQSLQTDGFATLPPILSSEECADLTATYDVREHFRSRIVMARFRFGHGEYKYFAAPLPPIVAELRASLYPRVAPIANDWMKALRMGISFPESLDDFLEQCHRSGQMRPTPLLLRYEAGGYNCMHQDLYGEIAFPLQFTFMLSRYEKDYSGGEFLLLEQRPRAQSRCDAITLQQGAAILFATRYRPVKGTRGFYRVNVRHGISRVRNGRRFALGIIFHDAK